MNVLFLFCMLGACKPKKESEGLSQKLSVELTLVKEFSTDFSISGTMYDAKNDVFEAYSVEYMQKPCVRRFDEHLQLSREITLDSIRGELGSYPWVHLLDQDRIRVLPKYNNQIFILDSLGSVVSNSQVAPIVDSLGFVYQLWYPFSPPIAEYSSLVAASMYTECQDQDSIQSEMSSNDRIRFFYRNVNRSSIFVSLEMDSDGTYTFGNFLGKTYGEMINQDGVIASEYPKFIFDSTRIWKTSVFNPAIYQLSRSNGELERAFAIESLHLSDPHETLSMADLETTTVQEHINSEYHAKGSLLTPIWHQKKGLLAVCYLHSNPEKVKDGSRPFSIILVDPNSGKQAEFEFIDGTKDSFFIFPWKDGLLIPFLDKSTSLRNDETKTYRYGYYEIKGLD